MGDVILGAFLESQADYILFLNGFSLVFLSASAYILRGNERIHWKWLVLSAFLLGLSRWGELIFFSIPSSYYFNYTHFLLILGSSLSMIEFARNFFCKKIGCLNDPAWLYLIVLAGISFGALWGIPGLALASIAIAGIPGALATFFILSSSSKGDGIKSSRLMTIAGLSLAVAWILQGIDVYSSAHSSAPARNCSEICIFISNYAISVQTFFLFLVGSGLWTYFSLRQEKNPEGNLGAGLKKYKFLFPISLCASLFVGWWITEIVGASADEKKRNEILDTVKAIAAAINPSLIESLTGTPSDLSSENYKELQARLTAIGNSQSIVRYMYMMRLNDATLIFLIDSEPDRFSNPEDPLSSPGDTYEDATKEYFIAVKNGTPLVEGPAEDSWGKWVTALVPLHSKSDGKLLGSLGMDVDASDWSRLICKERFAPISATMLVCITLTIFFILRRKEEETILKISVSERRYKTLVEGAPSCIELLDADGKYLSVNKYGILKKELDPESLTGLDFSSSWHLEQDRIKAEKALAEAKEGRVSSFEAETLGRDSSKKIWELVLNPVTDPNGRISGFVAISNEITERKIAEQNLLKAKEETEALNRQLEASVSQAKMLAIEAESANAAKSVFLANMSHEIRTPMNGVIGMVGILLDSKLDNEQRQCAEIIKKSAENLLLIINDILDFSKIEAGSIELEKHDFNLRQLVEDSLDAIALKAQKKNLELASFISSDVPLSLRGDSTRLRQVLTNLLENALKFTEKGEVSLDISLMRKTESSAEISFSVKDTGIGIPQDGLALLFKPFSQVDSSTSRKYGGTGLGLSISKQIVEKMSGNICVESAPGKGSKFTFTARLDIRSAVSSEESRQVFPQTFSNSKILCIDDNATNRLVLSKLVDSFNLKHDEADGSSSAIDLMNRAVSIGAPYKIAILDMFMPGMDGEALAKLIREDSRLSSTRLVMMSSAGIVYSRRFKESGLFDAVLSKPVKKGQLYDCLALLLDKDMKEEKSSAEAGSPSSPKQLQIGHFKPDLKVLLVEDNEVNQMVAKAILGKMGVSPAQAYNGNDALRLLENKDYDLVLLDVQMPGMNGYELSKIVRSPDSKVKRHEIPIIAMTAHAVKGDKERCIAAGMDDYVSKPISPTDLWKAMSKYASPLEENDSASGLHPDEELSADENTIFDRKALMERILGDEDLFKELRDVFLEDAAKQMEQMKEHFKRGEMEKLKYSVHTLKGSAANFGAVAAQKRAMLIESKISQDSHESIGALLAQLESDIDMLKKHFSK